jgi:hypothetical protein
MKKLIFLLIPLICVLLLASCDMTSIQDKMEQMSENLKDKIIDVAGPYIEKNTDTDTNTDEVLDNDTGDIPTDIPSDVPSDIPSDIPSDSDTPDIPDIPDVPVIPEKPEYVILEREKYPYKTFSGPEDYGKLTFEYPKTWSVYIAAAANKGGDFNGIK